MRNGDVSAGTIARDAGLVAEEPAVRDGLLEVSLTASSRWLRQGEPSDGSRELDRNHQHVFYA